ncbi:GntR family transcriptional regulator [Corallococcus sp. RDP092CA]
MEMGRGGLVAYVEAQLELDIALGRVHPSGQFGPEAKLARRFGVCRGTIREALRRLAARGLVVQHPGRNTRAVALDESLTLENLGLALHDARSPDARWLLEGYFSLRRQVMVELLTDCCAKASERDLSQLKGLCFQLWDAARWEPGARCAQVEFELLRLAARVAARPGHVLLVQSLQRAFMVGAARLLPLLGGEALREWANCAQVTLMERNVHELQHELPALMKAYDEQVLEQFAPALRKTASLETHRDEEGLVCDTVTATSPSDAMTARPGTAAHGLGCLEPVAEPSSALETCLGVETPGLGVPAQALVRDEALNTRPCVDEGGLALPLPGPTRDARPSEEEEGTVHLAPVVEQGTAAAEHTRVRTCGLGGLAPVTGDGEALGAAQRLRGEVLSGEPNVAQRLLSAWGLPFREGGDSPVDARGHLPGGMAGADGLLHGTWGRLGRWAMRLWRFVACSLGPAAS